ncbi:hypothetical protein ACN99C_26895 (plasmid) [Pseudomonas alloputida]|uniref:hypothetical protein n=1 Tax=Pseudomonas alloputida TaxID=1940621 RepID=UPI003B437778
MASTDTPESTRSVPSREVSAFGVITTVCATVAGGLFFGISEKSWAVFQSSLLIAAFAAAPFLGSQLKDLGGLFRLLGRGLQWAWLLLILWSIVAVADRLYWVNANTYPTWLSRSVTISKEMALSDKIYASVCTETYAWLEHKQNGHFMRCGDAFWPATTYRIENFEQMIEWIKGKEGAQ